ncbi:Hypothetical predicted protein, partial [Marmota monax]
MEAEVVVASFFSYMDEQGEWSEQCSASGQGSCCEPTFTDHYMVLQDIGKGASS